MLIKCCNLPELSAHGQEAETMLSELFDEKYLRERYDIALAEQNQAIGKAIGEERGKAIGEAKGIIKALVALVKKGILTVPQAAKEADMTVEEFEAKSGLKAI